MSDDREDPKADGGSERQSNLRPRYDSATDSLSPQNDDYKEGTNGDGEIVRMEHGDGPMTTQAELEGTRASFGMSGRPQRNEEGTKEVCVRLAEVLSQRTRELWKADDHEPLGPESGVDWVLVNADGRTQPVQVTRVGHGSRWREIGKTGIAKGTAEAWEAAEDVWRAIEGKRLAQDPDIILALHGGQPGYYAFPNFVDYLSLRKDKIVNLMLSGMEASPREQKLHMTPLNGSCRPIVPLGYRDAETRPQASRHKHFHPRNAIGTTCRTLADQTRCEYWRWTARRSSA